MRKIALVTARAARHRDEDSPLLEAALRARGVDVHVMAWDDPAVAWSAFDAAIVRSTWDYTRRLAEFKQWIAHVSTATTVLNAPSLLRWNVDKHYLVDLAACNVPTIPTTFVEPGENAAHAIEPFLRQSTAAAFVVKPAVGAGAKEAQRYGRSDADHALAIGHVHRLLHVGRSVLLQPYLEHVDVAGETGLIYFAGQFSHAIRKGALLRPGEGPTDDLFAAAQVVPRMPDQDELAIGARVLAAIPAPPPLYARVDLIRDRTGTPCVVELELTEPSLFLTHAPPAAERFAEAIIRGVDAVHLSASRIVDTGHGRSLVYGE